MAPSRASRRCDYFLAEEFPDYLCQGQTDDIAVRAFDALHEATSLALDTNNYSALLNRAIASLRADKLEPAQQDYEVLQKAFPTAFQIYFGLGEIAWRRKDTNAAVRNYQLYLANAPTNSSEAKLVSARLQELKPGTL